MLLVHDGVLAHDVPEAERNRFSLGDEDVLELARYAVAIERHYGRPMDVEWGRDGRDGKIYVLPARPETVTVQPRWSKLWASATSRR